MAGEYNPGTNTPSVQDRASKVLLRLTVMKDCPADKEMSEKAFRDTVRGLGGLTTGEVISSQSEDGSVYLGVSSTEDLASDLKSTVLAAHDTIRSNMLPYELDGARMSQSTFNVSAGAVWRNLGLNPGYDVTDQAYGIIDAARDQMWEAEREIAYSPAAIEGL
jgi:hypothetical protein